jgi:hypothetical protein
MGEFETPRREYGSNVDTDAVKSNFDDWQWMGMGSYDLYCCSLV